MKSYNEMADDVLRRVGEYSEKQRQKRKPVMRMGAVAACFCLAAIVGITAWGEGSLTPSPEHTTGTEASVKETNNHFENSSDNDNANIGHWPIDYVPDRSEVKIIASYNDGINENDICDTVPKDGEIVFSQRLMNAIEEYGDSVLYLVNVDVFSNGAHLEADSPQVASVREQLTEDGCIVAFETYFDGTENRYYSTIHAKLNQLTEFEAYENYGYRFSLY